MALMLLIDKILSAIDDDEYVSGVFLDFLVKHLTV